MEQLTLPPLSLYVHYPWCIKKCPYCDFNSHPVPQTGQPDQDYLDALLIDLSSNLSKIGSRPVQTIYFGGGTPSLMRPDMVESILNALGSRLASQAEVTLETNPGSIEQGIFSDFKQAGVNRISVGVQSFSDQFLPALGRIHTGYEAQKTIEEALHCFDKVNIDLMYGLPKQSVKEAVQDLETAISLGTDHISAYQLTLEEGTAFGRRAPKHMPVDDMLSDISDNVEKKLTDAGFEHYEVSAFARKEHACQHNLNYWHFGDYLGIGAGAHGKITDYDEQGCFRVVRTTRASAPRNYMSRSLFELESVQVVPEELGFEFMLNALRLKKGVSVTLFEARTGVSLSSIEGVLQRAKDKNWLRSQADIICPTDQGFRFLNPLLELFLA